MKINLFNLNFFYNHVCSHGIDHEGEDRRQWNQIGFKKDLEIKNFYFLNSKGLKIFKIFYRFKFGGFL